MKTTPHRARKKYITQNQKQPRAREGSAKGIHSHRKKVHITTFWVAHDTPRAAQLPLEEQ